MMLARDYTSCHVARNTLVMLVENSVQKLRWPAKRLDLNTNDHLVDLLKRVVREQPMQSNFRYLARVINQLCAAIPQQFIHRHILLMSIDVDAIPGGFTKYRIEIKYDVV